MLHFFRKIRKGLLSDNKFSKYLVYAIGEIFLVVIGILIALQINNWNQRQQAKAYEVTMLNQINSALDQDINNFEWGLKYLDSIQRSVIKLAFISDNTNYPQDSIEHNFTTVRQGGIAVAINSSPYESLKSAGLDKITNPELRSSISYLYEVRMRSVEFWVNDYIRKKLEERETYVKKVFKTIITPDSITGVKAEHIVNHEMMNNDPKFQQFLLLSSDYIPIAQQSISYGMRSMKALKEEINTELKK